MIRAIKKKTYVKYNATNKFCEAKGDYFSKPRLFRALVLHIDFSVPFSRRKMMILYKVTSRRYGLLKVSVQRSFRSARATHFRFLIDNTKTERTLIIFLVGG